jgi:hypothetical protein
MSEELKQHLRQDHGVHEGSIEIALTDDESSYLPGLGTEENETLHRQHHAQQPRAAEPHSFGAPRNKRGLRPSPAIQGRDGRRPRKRLPAPSP